MNLEVNQNPKRKQKFIDILIEIWETLKDFFKYVLHKNGTRKAYCFTTWFFLFLGSSFFQIIKAEYTSLFLIADEIILFNQVLTFGNVDSFNFFHLPYIYVFMYSQDDFFSSRSLLPAFFQVLSVWEWLFTCTLPSNDTKISFDDFKFQHYPFVYTYIHSYIHISYFSLQI